MNLLCPPGLRLKEVRIGCFELSNDAQIVLFSGWLGTGLGLTAYDPVPRVGGLLHAPLAQCRLDTRSATGAASPFAEAAVISLFEALKSLGAQTDRLQICLAGAARFMQPSALLDDLSIAGQAIALLAQYNLKPHAQAHPGVSDQRMTLTIATGEVRTMVSGQANSTVLWRNSIGS